MQKSRSLFVVFLICCIFALYPASSAGINDVLNTEKAYSQKYAVLVGVADYQYVNDLPSSYISNDLSAMQDVLISKCGFSSSNVYILKNSQATKSNIKNKLGEISMMSGRNDLVLFYFTGLGMNGADRYPYDESDGKDEYIIPYDSSLTSYSNDIRDDELYDWCKKISSKTTLLIIDSAFSGGIVKGEDKVPDSEQGVQKTLTAKEFDISGHLTDDLAPDFMKDLSGSQYLVLMACGPTETCGFHQSRINSAFTYYIVEGLGSTSADTNSNGWISAEESFYYARTPASANAAKPQNAQIYDGDSSNQADLNQYRDSQPPSITSLSPSSASAGGSTFTLTVNGQNFVSGCKVRWNGYDRSTTFVSSTQVKASISAGDIANPGSATVTVYNPDGKTSNGMTFSIQGSQPSPSITSLSPSSASAGGSTFTLTVNGQNFVSGCKVRWNGYDRSTTFVSSTQVKASIPAGDIANPGSATVTVYNPDGKTSNGIAFTITGGGGCTQQTFSGNLGYRGRAYHSIEVPSGASSLKISLDGGSGFSFYIRKDSSPSQYSYTWAGSSTSPVTINNPSAGTYNIMVYVNSGMGGSYQLNTYLCGSSGENNPSPSITSLSPSSASAGGSTFTLTVNGQNFVSGCKVRWNGYDRSTTFVSSTQVKASISAGDIANPGSATVTVYNPDGKTSNGMTFSIQGSQPSPSITSLSPSSASAGGSTFTLTVNGQNFVSGCKVRWNGYDRSTTFVSSTQVKASIPAGDIANPGSATVTVYNPDGKTSNGMTFSITGGGGCCTQQTFSGTLGYRGRAYHSIEVPVGISSLRISFDGVSGSDISIYVRKDFSPTPHSYDWAGSGSSPIIISNPSAGKYNIMIYVNSGMGGSYQLKTFLCEYLCGSSGQNNLDPSITSLSPSSASAGGSAFTLTVNGQNFVSGSKVRWNGADRSTTFVSSTQVKASISAGDIANPGSVTVTVYNPDGKTSNGMTFSIQGSQPSPSITSLSPSSASAGGSAFTLTVNGQNFVSGSKVRWNGADRSTTFVSSTQVKASISAGDIANPGSATVSVYNPDGLTSNGMTFSIGSNIYRNKYAVLVGIADYRSTSDLPSAYIRNDISAMNDVLLQKCGFSSSNIYILQDSQATKSGIKNALTNLERKTTTDDLVVFYFTGNGLSGPDTYPYDETDGKDEYLTPYDGSATSAYANIRDDELKDWCNRVPAKHFLLILDAGVCGGMTKFAPTESVTASGKTISSIIASQDEELKDGLDEDFRKDLSGGKYLVLMACDASESCGFHKSYPNSAFTYYIVQGLKTSSADTNRNSWISAEEAFTYAKPLARTYSQVVQNAQIYDGSSGQQVEMNHY